MRNLIYRASTLIIVLSLFLSTFTASAQKEKTNNVGVHTSTTSQSVTIELKDNQKLYFEFYGKNIFRLFLDPKGASMRPPKSTPLANILVKNPKRDVGDLKVETHDDCVYMKTEQIEIVFNKIKQTFSVTNLKTGKVVIKETSPVKFDKKKTEITLEEDKDEYFYGGGVQNGRFSHKGNIIAIENQNSWTDGGVASPTPFYWSTKGYGFMWYTFKKGTYDFGATLPGKVILAHNTDYLDVFFMINEGVVPLLNDFYQLTGAPVLIPKFGFYEGHLNAYNRDYWKETKKDGILFEDGKYYKESQKDNGGIKESLNGEKDNYQFSARGVVDRYLDNDMPLGWVLPNDGYGAGYGQTGSLDGNIENLKKFGDYAREHGVEIGLWTQSDLHPIDSIQPLLQRDIVKEVGVAGVRVLKTDVAWVGAGYSFGLNGVQDAAEIMEEKGNKARPFIISLDGWAGTQRYATIWTGDQTGGVWEYIRFHIPTYIGSGLSGQPNICSDMDGIFGGSKPIVNTRDFQWKTFTLMQLNMDGWGANPKYPQILGEPFTSINRNYLKLKSELLPYSYSVSHESVHGLPAIRAMFLEEANPFTLGKNTEYQFMYGPSFLIAPIYQNTDADREGNDIRNNIYLPKGEWIDYFTGEIYKGGQIINHFNTPIWKLPVLVKRGAIIPMVNPNNNPNGIDKGLRIYEIYPHGNSSFTAYDDDGKTTAYINNECLTTKISSEEIEGKVHIVVEKSKGSFNGLKSEKKTIFRINTTQSPKKIRAKINGKKCRIKEVNSIEDFNSSNNVFFYNKTPNLNQFSTLNSEFAKEEIHKNPQIWVKIDKVNILNDEIELDIKGYEYNPINSYLSKDGALKTVDNAKVVEDKKTAYSITPTWDSVENADFYQISFNNMLYTNILDNEFTFNNLSPETNYSFKIRAVNTDGASDWITVTTQTKSDPLEFAIHHAEGESDTKFQGSHNVSRLLDFDENSSMHTKYYKKAIPFNMIIDLKSVNQLDKIQYIPRKVGLNGVFQKGTIYTSIDKVNWTEAGSFDWKRDNTNKIFAFEKRPTVRYVKININKAVGDYGSGKQIYFFKVPGTESYIPGDINKDKKIDKNDLTSYMNYTGLRKGDSDFDYVSIGDVNKNGSIDAYDISNVATQLDGGVSKRDTGKVAGSISIKASKRYYRAGEKVIITVKGVKMNAVNAYSFAIPYSVKSLEFIGVKENGTQKMMNLTYDRLHSNGDKVLYPTFVNIGEKETINGDNTILKIEFKAKTSFKFNLKAKNIILVDKKLNSITK
ncbi:DUF5110 domain-containing protein [Halosquirtibacter laminarini]|uniref:DUF5110 domain-containing protein n=1 Tax=Halosquirtibacter laminarini TaxID=3374600 RepID=A0AC61NPQ4_9BACT|nr:DUF5110 domain-containing protein [Prolixibacteraceae bacterium]